MICDRKQAIAEKFGNKVETYDSDAVMQQGIAAKLAGLLPEHGASDILEIGAGTGFLTSHILKRYPDGQFLITDLSDDMLHFCKTKYAAKNTRFQTMDADTPNTNEKFDLIVSSMTAQWFDDPSETLNNLKKLLKPNGKIFYSALGPKSFWEWKETVSSLNLPHGTLTERNYPGIIHEDTETISYDSTMDFLKDMKKIGAQHPKPGYTSLHPAAFRKACALHDQNHGGKFTWHIVYGCLRA